MRAKTSFTSIALALIGLMAAIGSAATDDAVLWPEHQRAFIQDGPGLLLDAEGRRQLRSLDEAGRDRFIADFLRDPLPETELNELVAGIEQRQRLVRQTTPSPFDDRARLLFLHGRSAAIEEIDCGTTLVPIEIWSYGEGRNLLLYQSPGRRAFRLWRPHHGKRVLYSSLVQGWFGDLEAFGQEQRRFDIRLCKATVRVDAVTHTVGLIDESPNPELARQLDFYLRPPADLAVWSQQAGETVVPADKPQLAGVDVDLEFQFRAGSRIAARFVVTLDPEADLAVRATGDGSEIEIEIDGLLEYEGRVFEDFHLRFDRDPPPPGEPVVLVFERRLRPGRNFLARLRVRDSVGGAELDVVRVVAVPREVERVARGGSGSSVPAEEVAAAGLAGVDSLVLVPPVTDGLSRAWRAEALVTGDRIRKVVFLVDDDRQLTRTRPPYTADLRLAAVPVEQVISVRGLDAQGELVAEDRVVLNRARGSFQVQIVSPRQGEYVTGTVLVQAEVGVPDEARLEEVEFSINEKILAKLDKPPWEVPVDVDLPDEVIYLTVKARLAGGARVEDVLFLNAPANLEHVDVGLVELFATVTDGSGRLIGDLADEDFEVLVSGQARPIQRFDLVHNLPLVVGFAIDTSTSMADRMAETRQAAVGFLHSVMRPGDRAFAVSFSSKPELVAPPTDDPAVVERALLGVHSTGWTALYDAVVRSLFYFRGFGGRRALVLLSDGEDTSSRASFDDALAYAQQSGAVVYSIGLGGGASGGKLKRLAVETGGRYFQVTTASELDSVYAQIERELRSQYFLTFAPATAGEIDLGQIEVRIRDRNLKVRATRGYAP